LFRSSGLIAEQNPWVGITLVGMGRHSKKNRAARAKGWRAVVQWILLAVFAVLFVFLGIGLVSAACIAITRWLEEGWSTAGEDLARYGVPYSFGIAILVLLGFGIRDCIYRLIGKEIPPSSGGGIYV
jgi:hypothetical protein